MALDAFNNLKEKKQKDILASIRNSLRKETYENLSVGDISLDADISRGSFYNYFVDKYDAVFTLIAKSLKNQVEFFKSSVEKNLGDIFKSTLDLYDEVSAKLEERMNDVLMSNLKIYMNIVIRIIYSKEYAKDVEGLVLWLCDHTTIGKDKIVDAKGMANVLELLFSTAVHELARDFVISEERKKYVSLLKKIEIIKNGVYATR